ncbi:hypothetical protein GLOTRDRAFT_136278 [Gloeophyllum trabeum ATCC 11539]|uniref:Uncharacterized protein n=1 Tax=Gloeophyllum trabeum (strain ATCC 11539 / FP-39264 / Madison 617) TaxID=670483 RepID=S7RWY1_GLOTA|nr:uncharacterized protein GLOTRDRAFT_136278 [Gloeophyllum trabeum ATCC 11539]EPQ59400.1 hypothetical protein GLOTRDRAFT_136278 [Gloeophyllum trabeum ATCC 11539]
MTSELSDALNPYAVQSRARSTNVVNHYASPVQPVVQQPRPYVPHRSELELAITEPPSPRPPPQSRPQPRPGPEGANVNAVRELFRVIAATKEASELERKRRLAWEQEQEAKHVQRESELERQIVDLRQEMASLRAQVALLPSMLLNSVLGAAAQSQIGGASVTTEFSPPHPISPHSQPSYSPNPAPQAPRLAHPVHPMSPISQPPSRPHPLFVEGSSSRPFLVEEHSDIGHDGRDTFAESSPSVVSSPQFRQTVPPSRETVTTSTVPQRRRRTDVSRETDGDDEGSAVETSDGNPERPLKRRNHRDTRILTIQHAMRHQMLKSMGLENDKQLPDNHIEGAPLGPSEPVRFVWLKTIKQSEHNANMRKRVLEELKANRKLYKHVPEQDFNDATLEAVFDQAFTTFRHKFKTQKDAFIAEQQRAKETQKAMKARRLLRKKTKLANRSEMRSKISVFAHETFDGALQVECMSSEDSMDEDIRFGVPRVQDKGQVLRIRGLLWRSSRLQRFFGVLDEEDKLDKTMKPKRGLGRKERCFGPPRDGMPPKGVASWMISRRWLRNMELTQPDFSQALKDVIVDVPGFNWEHFHDLGDESDDEYELQGFGLEQTQPQYPVPYQDTSYSLQYALAPVS